MEGIIRKRNDPVFGFGRLQVDAFTLGEFEQQVAAFLGRGGDQRGMRDVPRHWPSARRGGARVVPVRQG